MTSATTTLTSAAAPPAPAAAAAAAGGGARAPARASSSGDLLEHQPLEPPQLLARLEPELVGEEGARVAVGGERVGLAPAAVEREHQLAAQALAQRVRGDELLQLGDELGVAAEREVGLDAPLEHGEPLLAQPLRLVARQALELEPLQRLAAPQRERLAQQLGRRGGVARQPRLRARRQPLEARRRRAAPGDAARSRAVRVTIVSAPSIRRSPDT